MVNSRFLILSSTLLLCLSGPAPAQDSVSGMDSRKAPEPATPLSAADEQATTPAPAAADLTIKKYQDAVLSTERTRGAYDDSLWEQLVGLATAQQKAGRDADAVASLNQALHIHRVNHGLHNLGQEPILNLLIKSNSALSDWKALDQNFHYLYWLYRRVYGDNDTHLLPVIDRVGQWQLRAYRLDTKGNPLDHLQAAQDLYSDAVHIIETNQGKYAAEIVKPLYGIMLVNYYIARDLNFVTYDPSNSMCGTRSFFHRDPFFDDCYGNRQMSDEELNRQEVISSSYRAGKKALNHMLEVYENNPDLPVLDHARAYLYLGDWYMLFNRPSSALSTYARAYEMLGNTNSDLKQKLFGAPRSLPETQFLTQTALKTNAVEKYVVVTMDISRTGKARNIQVVESQPPGDKKLAALVRDSLRDTRFAPRFVNGEPVATTGYTKKFIFE